MGNPFSVRPRTFPHLLEYSTDVIHVKGFVAFWPPAFSQCLRILENIYMEMQLGGPLLWLQKMRYYETADNITPTLNNFFVKRDWDKMKMKRSDVDTKWKWKGCCWYKMKMAKSGFDTKWKCKEVILIQNENIKECCWNKMKMKRTGADTKWKWKGVVLLQNEMHFWLFLYTLHGCSGFWIRLIF